MKYRLKELLQERQIGITKFADELGVNYRSLPTKEEFVPTLERTAMYAKALRVPIWELFYDCGVPYIDNGTDEYIVQDYQCVNEKIRQFAALKHLTITEIGKRCGMSQSGVTNNLKSKNLSLTVVEKLCNALEVEPYELFISKEDMQREIARRKGEPVAERVVSMEQPERKPMDDSYQEDLFAQNETTASDDDMIITMGGRRYRLVPMD